MRATDAFASGNKTKNQWLSGRIRRFYKVATTFVAIVGLSVGGMSPALAASPAHLISKTSAAAEASSAPRLANSGDLHTWWQDGEGNPSYLQSTDDGYKQDGAEDAVANHSTKSWMTFQCSKTAWVEASLNNGQSVNSVNDVQI